MPKMSTNGKKSKNKSTSDGMDAIRSGHKHYMVIWC